MRLLQPDGELGDDDLETAYAYPAERTWLRLNMVTSVDGAVTDHAGRAQGLSSREDQRVFALLRTLADVVVVGAGTARTEGYAPVRRHEVDGPLRERLGLAPVPPLTVVSRRLDLPDLVLQPSEPEGAPTLVATPAAAPADRVAELRGRGVEVLVCGHDDVDLRELRDRLAGRGLRRILCEGGPQLAGTLVGSGALDEVCVTVSPQLVAGPARRLLAGDPVDPALPLRLAHVLAAGDELLVRYLLERPRG